MRIQLTVTHNNQAIPLTVDGSENDIREGRLRYLKVTGATMNPNLAAVLRTALKNHDYSVVAQPARIEAVTKEPRQFTENGRIRISEVTRTIRTQPARFANPLSIPPMRSHEEVGARIAEVVCVGASLLAIKPTLQSSVLTMHAAGVGCVPAVAGISLVATAALLPGVALASATGAYLAGAAVNWASSRKNQ